MFRRMEVRTEDLPPKGTTSPIRDKVYPWGQLHPWGSKMSTGVKLARLKTGLSEIVTLLQGVIDSCKNGEMDGLHTYICQI
jgi:hypothetical protein